MTDGQDTVLTDRQVEILELRAEGHTQKEVADILGTTDSNISAIEQAAESNIERAKNTVALSRTLEAAVQFTVEGGIAYDEFIDRIYEHGDEAGVQIAFSGPELSGILFRQLEAHVTQGTLEATVKVGITDDGDVNVFSVGSQT